MKVGNISNQYVFSSKRLEAKFFMNEDAVNSRIIEEGNFEKIELGKLAQCFNPPVFKRQFCDVSSKYAVEYCQSSDITNVLDGSSRYINRNQAEKINALVEKNWILITGFGTIGNVRLVNNLSAGVAYANNVCRIISNDKVPFGYIYAFLSSKFGIGQVRKNASGSVVRYIEAPGIKKVIIPILPKNIQQSIHERIEQAARLREEANRLLSEAEKELKEKSNLPDLKPEEYDFFGAKSHGERKLTYTISKNQMTNLSINAFNYSEKIRKIIQRVIDKNETLTLSECLDKNQIFNTRSFKRIEIKSPKAIKLINQQDIFNVNKIGKQLARSGIKADMLVEYGEVLIAGVGTLGENEVFCKAIFANEELENQLVSGEFLRMKTNEKVPIGYLYTWLASDYGFRMIRSTQSGTKLCRPIRKLLLKMPVPIHNLDFMNEIDKKVKTAYTKRYEALQLETQSITQLENEIASWQK